MGSGSQAVAEVRDHRHRLLVWGPELEHLNRPGQAGASLLPLQMTTWALDPPLNQSAHVADAQGRNGGPEGLSGF